MAHLLWATDAGAGDPRRVGGKAAGLARLAAAGARVPEWFAVPVEVLAEHLARGGLAGEIARELGRLTNLVPGTPEALREIEAVGASLHAAVESIELAPEAAAGIGEAVDRLAPGPFAVRSSMVGEDSERHSWAGQLATFLYCRDRSAVLAAVVGCWASAFSARSLAYRLAAGASQLPAVGVVVQRMVSGAVSGVLFTADPVSRRRDHARVSACWGLGEGVVSGACNADEYLFAADRELSARVADKDVQLVADPAGGTREVQVPAERRRARCLPPAELAILCREGLRVAAAFGAPQDIEWTLDGDQLYLLQARPITSLGAAEQPRAAWDASNIQESYGGVTTPLTFSFASRFYQVPFRSTLIALGVPAADVDRLPAGVERGLIGLLGGRVFYNTHSWFRALLTMPSFQQKKRDFEQVLGIAEGGEFAEQPGGSLGARLRRQVVGRAVMNLRFAAIERSITRFLADFEQDYRRYDRAALARADLPRLIELIDELGAVFLDRWHRSNVNDFFLLMASGRLRRALAPIAGREAPRYFASLVQGADVESAEQARLLRRIADRIRAAGPLAAAVRQGDEREALARIRRESPEAAAMLDDYLDRYGDRCMGELKLESITLRDDPAVVVKMLRNYLVTAPAAAGAEPAAGGRLSSELTAGLGWRQRLELARAIRAARLAIRLRESTRLARTRMFGLHRDLFRAVGARLHEAGRLREPRDVFYLTVDEIQAFGEGRAVSADLAGLVAARKLEYEAYQRLEVPQRLETTGVPYHAPELSPSAAPAPRSPDARVLHGLGCSSGVVEAPLRVILAPDDDLGVHGRILTTERTDPGWAPLFPTARGILVERGNMLSHSAVLARELGIPAVVGIPDLLKIVADGDRVRLDGGAGTVERLGIEP